MFLSTFAKFIGSYSGGGKNTSYLAFVFGFAPPAPFLLKAGGAVKLSSSVI